MTVIEFKAVDDDYEGLLSSYIESDAWRKMMFHRNFNLENTKTELADEEEKASTENPIQ